jgi:hypothetical protein
MSEHDQPVSSVEAMANPAPSQGRRRFVKGAILAGPAIITLRTSSALPQLSMNCAERVIAAWQDGQNPQAISCHCFNLYPESLLHLPENFPEDLKPQECVIHDDS